MARFFTKADLPIADQHEVDRILAIASAQRTSVEKQYLLYRQDYIYNGIDLRDSDDLISVAHGNTLPDGIEGFSAGARFVLKSALAGEPKVFHNIGDETSADFRMVGNIEFDGAPATEVAAALSTDFSGDDNDIIFTSELAGALGNQISVIFRDPEAASQSLSVSVVRNQITINLATNSSRVITSTAAEVITAIEASMAASALVSVALNEEDTNFVDGSGVVVAMGETFLEGGVSVTGTGYVHTGALLVNYTDEEVYINVGDKETPDWSLYPAA